MPVAAADVCDARALVQPLDDAVQRRQPFRDERRAVGVAVERPDAAVEVLVVLAPGDTGAGAERLERPLLIEPHRGGDLERRRHEDRAVLVHQHRDVLGR